MTTRVDLGATQNAVSIFTTRYSVTTIQQLLKGKDVIVMKRSLYCQINNVRANYYALVIHKNKGPYHHFLVCLTAHLKFSFKLKFEPIKRHT